MPDVHTFSRELRAGAPTLYIGFSGVLNIGEGLYHPDGRIELSSERELFEFAPLLIDDLAPYPDVQLVLTTKWVDTLGEDGTVKILPSELGSRVCGTLQRWPKTGIEAINWQGRTGPIIRHARHHNLTDWFALGDDVYGAPAEYESRFFCTKKDAAYRDAATRQKLRAWLSAPL